MTQKKIRILLAEDNCAETVENLNALFPDATGGWDLTVVSTMATLIPTVKTVGFTQRRGRMKRPVLKIASNEAKPKHTRRSAQRETSQCQRSRRCSRVACTTRQVDSRHRFARKKSRAAFGTNYTGRSETARK
jgi:hypothetical protein